MKKQHLHRRFGSHRIIPFIGFGNNREVFISGLVVAGKGLLKPVEGQTRWKNFKAMIRRYTANEIENADVEVIFLGRSKIATTDKFGIFRCHFEIDPDMKIGPVWQKYYVSLFVKDRSHQPGAPLSGQTEGEVMMITVEPEFGIISDIDDTILVSYATQKLQKLRLMLLNNSLTRMPFHGVASLYRALQIGRRSDTFNPVFYVSNSEWNLYDLLYEFIEFNRIPKGPLILREMAIVLWRPWKIREVNRDHKTQVIRRLFSVFNNMKFILIGDSGQKDPAIYSQIIKEFPGRVLAVYIRDIGISENTDSISVMINQLKNEYKTEMLMVKDSEAAARHAFEKGFIGMKKP